MIAIARPFALHANAKSTERENKTWIPIFYDITLHEMPKLAQDKPERVIWVQNGGGGDSKRFLWTFPLDTMYDPKNKQLKKDYNMQMALLN